MSSVQSSVIQDGALVIYLDQIKGRGYLPSVQELEETYQLPVLLKLQDGVVYGTELQ